MEYRPSVSRFEEMKARLEALKAKLDFASVNPHRLPAIDPAELAGLSDQQAHELLNRKLTDYIIERGNHQTLDFLSRKMQAFRSLHPGGTTFS